VTALIPSGVKLTPVENKAYEDWTAKNQPAMAPTTAANFFTLFVEGYSMEQMIKANPSWKLGCVVDARIRYKWDERLQQHIEEVHRQALERMSKFKSEAINHILDTLTVVHQVNRDAMMKYIQNPIEENIPDSGKLTTREYKDLLESLERVMKIGQPVAAPVAQQPSVAVIAPNATVISADSSSSLGSIISKMADEARARVMTERKE
jgi:hypothetical protein